MGVARSREEKLAHKARLTREWRKNNPDKVRASNRREAERRRNDVAAKAKNAASRRRRYHGLTWEEKRAIQRKAKNLPCNHPRYAFWYALERRCGRYGITLEEYMALFMHQKGVCAICEEQPRKGNLTIDHCHASGKVRGLLCGPCNKLLGVYEGRAAPFTAFLMKYGEGNPLIYPPSNEGNREWRELHQKAAPSASCVMGAMGLAT